MSILAEKVRFDDDSIWIDLSDGRTIGVPLAWFPRLLNASKSELDKFTISSGGIQVHPERAFLKLLQQTIADIANTIAEFKTVTLLASKKIIGMHAQ